MTPDGNGHCNGTVKNGTDAGCDTGVCWNRDYFACRSGDECVSKTFCQGGKPQCQDRSDLEFCNIHNKGVCDSESKYTIECPTTSSSEYQECYIPTSNYFQYNCITRSDITAVTEEFVSIEPCNVTGTVLGDRRGLKCGDGCIRNNQWCRNDQTYSCKGNTSHFSSVNSILCGNYTFWSTLQDCNSYYHDGSIEYFGKRCSGGRLQLQLRLLI